MKAEVLTDAAALRDLEPEWWDLFARLPGASPFSAPAWLIPWWESFGPGKLSVVALRSEDRLVGLAPLYVEDGRGGRRLLPLGIGVTDTLDLLLDPADAADATVALGEALSWIGVGEWSAEEAAPDAAVLELPDPSGWMSTVAEQSCCPGLALAHGAGLRDAIPPGQWRKWQMARHRADRRGWAITRADAGTVLDDLGHLARLHARRWKERGEPGVLADERVRVFHERAAPRLLDAGLLRLLVLRIEGVVAGVFYGLQRGRMAAAYLGGFDPAFAFESPGTLLIGAALEEAWASGVELFSFLRGRETYKYRWGAVDRFNRLRVFRPLS